MILTNLVKQKLVSGLLPTPRWIRLRDGDLILSQKSKIYVCAGKDIMFVANRLSDLIYDQFGLRIVVEIADFKCSCIIIAEKLDLSNLELSLFSTSQKDQSYDLIIKSELAILLAPNRQGLLFAAMTFLQLITRQDFYVIACGADVSDCPFYKWRGFMIDSGRVPNSVPKIKRIIRICSMFKMNFMLFREGDDELNAVRYQSNRLGSTNPYALSMDDISELISYAKNLGITFIPEIESLGHSGAKRFDYPELVKGGFEEEYEGVGTHIRKSYLNPEDPRVYDLLESIYKEWIGVLEEPFIHIGMDEVPLEQSIQACHLKKVLRICENISIKSGKSIIPIVWSDAPQTPKEYMSNTVRCLWNYHEHFDFGTVSLQNEHLKRQGIEQLSTINCNVPVFMAGGSGSKHYPYSKDAYCGAISNLARWSMLGQSYGNWTGLLAVQWSGNMIDSWLPDFLAAADFGWKPPEEQIDTKSYLAHIKDCLSRITDASNPNEDELDPPAWDGIWLKNNIWHEDIMYNRKSVFHSLPNLRLVNKEFIKYQAQKLQTL